MRARLVVISGVGSQNASQFRFAKDQDCSSCDREPRDHHFTAGSPWTSPPILPNLIFGTHSYSTQAMDTTLRASIIERSIAVAGHQRSVGLEDAFWKALEEIAGGQEVTLSDLVTIIDCDWQDSELSSAIRVFVLRFYCDRIANHQGRARDLLLV